MEDTTNEIKDSLQGDDKEQIANEQESSKEINEEINKEEKETKSSESKKKKSFFGKSKESEIEKLKLEIEEKNVKVAEIHEKYLRLYSEFDNYRKRTQKEKLEIIKNASEDMITNLLPILDDFDRALAMMEKTTDIESTKEGVNLIYQKMLRLMQQKGLKAIDTKNQLFDTDFHEAITFIPLQEGMEANTIIDEVEKGYLLNEKVIRYSKVVIAK